MLELSYVVFGAIIILAFVLGLITGILITNERESVGTILVASDPENPEEVYMAFEISKTKQRLLTHDQFANVKIEHVKLDGEPKESSE